MLGYNFSHDSRLLREISFKSYNHTCARLIVNESLSNQNTGWRSCGLCFDLRLCQSIYSDLVSFFFQNFTVTELCATFFSVHNSTLWEPQRFSFWSGTNIRTLVAA